MKPYQKSFSTRLSLSILISTSILFIISIGIAFFTSHMLILREAELSSQRLLDATINEIELSIVEIESEVKGTAWMANERKADPQAMYTLTAEALKRNSKIEGCAIAFTPNYYKDKYYFAPYSYKDSATGEIRTKQLGNKSWDYFYMDWYQIPSLSGKTCWSEPYFDEGGGKFYMSTFSYPLKDTNGQIFAIVTADVNVTWISELLEKIKPYKSSKVSLISKCGNFINVAKDNKLRGETIYTFLKYAQNKGNDLNGIVKRIMSGEKGMSKYSINNEKSFSVFGPLKNGWILSITCDYREVLARSSTMHLILLIIGIFGLFLIFIISYSIVKKITNPLIEFSSAALSIAKGDFSTPLPEIKTDDEIRKLRDSFNHMQHSLTQYMESLRKKTAESERIESELDVASKIQMAMIPKVFPKHAKMDLYALLKPAKEVGGDYYDFLLKDNMLYFSIGDATGKGIPAAMLMAITKSVFHFVASLDLEPDEMVKKINRTLCDGNDNNMFVTMIVGYINLDTLELRYCNAGHNPIIIDGNFLNVKPNLVCGLIADYDYKMQEIQLKSGSQIVFYTDGVTEAENENKELFGNERLLEWAKKTATCATQQERGNHLLQTVRSFTDGYEQSDDITIMTIKIK